MNQLILWIVLWTKRFNMSFQVIMIFTLWTITRLFHFMKHIHSMSFIHSLLSEFPDWDYSRNTLFHVVKGLWWDEEEVISWVRDVHQLQNHVVQMHKLCIPWIQMFIVTLAWYLGEFPNTKEMQDLRIGEICKFAEILRWNHLYIDSVFVRHKESSIPLLTIKQLVDVYLQILFRS